MPLCSYVVLRNDPDLSMNFYLYKSQELLAERARLQSEVEALRASAAAEVNSSRAELEKLQSALAEQQATLAAKTEALAAGWLSGILLVINVRQG